MDKKLLKLPLLTLIGGIIYYGLIFILNFLGYGVTFSPVLTQIFLYLPQILNIVLIIAIGVILRKSYDRKTFIKAASLLVVYSFIILIIQKLTDYFGMEIFTLDFILYLPVAIFGIITSIFVNENNPEIINLIFMTLSLFEPYVLVLFSKNSNNHI